LHRPGRGLGVRGLATQLCCPAVAEHLTRPGRARVQSSRGAYWPHFYCVGVTACGLGRRPPALLSAPRRCAQAMRKPMSVASPSACAAVSTSASHALRRTSPWKAPMRRRAVASTAREGEVVRTSGEGNAHLQFAAPLPRRYPCPCSAAVSHVRDDSRGRVCRGAGPADDLMVGAAAANFSRTILCRGSALVGSRRALRLDRLVP